MKRWMEKLDAYLRIRLRMIIWKQWKTIRNRIKQLRKCGFPEWMANAYANCRKGIMRCASSFMIRAIPKATFDKAGLVSLLDYYTLKHIALQ